MNPSVIEYSKCYQRFATALRRSRQRCGWKEREQTRSGRPVVATHSFTDRTERKKKKAKKVVITNSLLHSQLSRGFRAVRVLEWFILVESARDESACEGESESEWKDRLTCLLLSKALILTTRPTELAGSRVDGQARGNSNSSSSSSNACTTQQFYFPNRAKQLKMSWKTALIRVVLSNPWDTSGFPEPVRQTALKWLWSIASLPETCCGERKHLCLVPT